MAAPAVVVIGAGQAGVETAAALRGRGFTGRITLIGEEPPWTGYRPPLSKGYLAGTTPAEDTALRPASFFAERDIEIMAGEHASSVNRDQCTVTLASGLCVPYDHLVLATGSRPRRLPVPGASLGGVLTLRSRADADELRLRLGGPPRQLVIVGAGFMGLEVAATARGLGHDVTVVEVQRQALARALTPALSSRIIAEHRAQGVRVLLGREVTALHGDAEGQVQVMELDGGERIAANLAVIGIGVLPCTELALTADLVVGDGIVVDERLRTSDPDIYALGDCARFPSPHAGRHLRIESVQNASDQAKCVAAGICEQPVAYTSVPWFWSEQYGLRLQLAGLTAGHDEAAISGDVEGGRFSVFCFRAGRLTGVESVNRPADHGISRRLLASGTALTPDAVRAPGFDLRKLPRTPSAERLAVHT